MYRTIWSYIDENRKLKAKNKKLRKALEIIINEKGDYWYDKMIRIAKGALKG